MNTLFKKENFHENEICSAGDHELRSCSFDQDHDLKQSHVKISDHN